MVRAAAKDSNLLMNIGPDGSGQFPAEAVSAMAEVGRWFAVNGESVYGTRAGGVGKGRQVVSTRKGDDVLYLHFLDPEVDAFSFRFSGKVASATLLDGGRPVDAVCSADGTLAVTLPEAGQNSRFDRVVKIRVADR